MINLLSAMLPLSLAVAPAPANPDRLVDGKVTYVLYPDTYRQVDDAVRQIGFSLEMGEAEPELGGAIAFKGIVQVECKARRSRIIDAQMLVKICAKDGIPLVNIVRSDAQVEILKGIGAKYIVNSSADDFMERLVDAIVETGATLGFDATGGGKLAGQVLTAMEAAAVKRMTTYSRYGSDTFKQVYIYGALDLSPTTFSARSFGLTWSLSGFLLTPFMAKAGMETVGRMRKRVVDELTTTFKSHYSHEISLAEALSIDVAQAYNAKRTGEKYLIKPHG